MYDSNSQERLREKVSYEIWLLDFLSKTQEVFEDGIDISTITLMNRQRSAHVDVTVTEELGSGKAMKIMNAVSPLTFVASYKIIDMIFEWILEENLPTGNIKEIPWKFLEKIKLISKRNDQMIYPPFFRSNRYIKEYLFALYSNLLKFRNEVVHNHNFSVTDSGFRISAKVEGQDHSLVLEREELGALVRTVVAVAYFLTGVFSFEPWKDRLLKYHLDRIKKLHCLAEFTQAKPILINVVLKVPLEKGVFPADLEFVRRKLSRIHPNANVLFNLRIIGLIDGKPSTSWFFPADSVPKKEVFELRQNGHEKYRVPLSEG